MATSYNCIGSDNSAYGAGDFGLCNGQTVGAPNTGLFMQSIDSASFTIIVPLAIAIVVVVIASVTVKFRKKQETES
ncbi:MAG: hypothetical protein H6797_00940 [Candidatus Nomurabacteria bacterium]|nr:MAG: hypothetical protein H6797_00940 [Candidatus Nomurabacteria bacterium]